MPTKTAQETLSLEQLCKDVRIIAEYNGEPAPWGDHSTADGWKVTLLRTGADGRSHRLTVPFWKGVAHHGAEPSALEVMECLCSDATSIENARDFADWCGDLGYDADSRRAEKTFLACQRIRDRLAQFLGDEFETFLYAETG